MAVGQVGFKDNKRVCCPLSRLAHYLSPSLSDGSQVKRILVPQRENPIVNRLNKTKAESYPDLAKEREDRLQDLRRREQAARQARQKEEARVAKERKEKKWARDHAYDDLFSEENMASASNQEREEGWEDDFM
jgi:hypothetical protein